MRILILCLVTLIMAGCKAQTPPSLKNGQLPGQTVVSELKELRYKRQSRSGNSLTSFGPEAVVFYKSDQSMSRYACSPKDWEEIKTLVQNLDLTGLPELQSPTDKRLYDGAAAVSLTVVLGTQSYVSSTFDDGYPPEEIADLVFKLLSLEQRLLNN
jgi:hypothetical protein